MGQCRGKFRDMHLHFLFCSVLFCGRCGCDGVGDGVGDDSMEIKTRASKGRAVLARGSTVLTMETSTPCH